MKKKTLQQGGALLIWALLLLLIPLKGLWQPAAGLLLLHLAELLLTGLKRGRKNGYPTTAAFLLTLLFGITWWGALKKEGDRDESQQG